MERDWAIRPYSEAPLGGWSVASNPGVFLTGTAADLSRGSFAQAFGDNGCSEIGGVLVNPANPAAGCRYHFTLYDNLVNIEHHYQTYGELNYEITGGLNLHLEGLWAKHVVPRERVGSAQSTVQFPTPIQASGGSPGGGTSPYPAVGLNQQSRYYVPATNPGLVAFLANSANCPALGAICANAAANGVITAPTLWRPLGYGGQSLLTGLGGADFQRREGEALRFAGELRGDIGANFSWTLGSAWQRNRGLSDTPEFAVNRLQLALLGLGGPNCNPATGTAGAGACQYFNPFANAFASSSATGLANPFYVPTATNSRELLAWIRTQRILRFETDVLTFDGQISGKLPVTLPGGNIEIAVGAQRRRDGYKLLPEADSNPLLTPCVDSRPLGDGVPVCSNGIGPFTFSAGRVPLDIDRSVTAAFGEIRLPVFESFEVTGALRFEDHEGNVPSTWNPKVAGRWQLFDALAVRGSFGTTFRAPPGLLTEDTFSRFLVNLTLPGVGALYRPTDLYGDPNLKPETATTYNAGAVISAGPLRATLDYWRFNFKDELVQVTAASVVSAMFPSATPSTFQCGIASLRSRFVFADDGNPATDDCTPANVLSVLTRYINGPRVKTSGIDATVSLTFKDLVAQTDVMIGGDMTYLINYDRGAVLGEDGVIIEPAIDRAGKSELLGAFYSYPRWRGNGYINISRGIANLRWTSRYKSGATNINGTPYKQKHELIHDLTMNLATPMGITLTASVQNILDTDPPFTRSQYNYDYLNAFMLGRTFTFGVKSTF